MWKLLAEQNTQAFGSEIIRQSAHDKEPHPRGLPTGPTTQSQSSPLLLLQNTQKTAIFLPTLHDSVESNQNSTHRKLCLNCPQLPLTSFSFLHVLCLFSLSLSVSYSLSIFLCSCFLSLSSLILFSLVCAFLRSESSLFLFLTFFVTTFCLIRNGIFPLRSGSIKRCAWLKFDGLYFHVHYTFHFLL